MSAQEEALEEIHLGPINAFNIVEPFCNEWLSSNPEKITKILESVKFLKDNGLNLVLDKKQLQSTDEWAIRVIDHDGTQFGYFQVEFYRLHGVLNITISTTDEGDDSIIKGEGIARLMIATMCIELHNKKKIRPDTYLYIDADASGGFWGHIGMDNNRYGDTIRYNRNVSGKGHELNITFRDLSRWAVGFPLGTSGSLFSEGKILKIEQNNTGGRKKNKTRRKYRKSKKTRKSKKSRKSKISRK